MTKAVRLALLGCGTIGGGVVRFLRSNAKYIATRVGAPVEVAKVLVIRFATRPATSAMSPDEGGRPAWKVTVPSRCMSTTYLVTSSDGKPLDGRRTAVSPRPRADLERRGQRRVLWLLPCALATSGCSLLARATIMPTVDTHGVVSVEAKLTGALGLTTSFDHEKAQDSTIGVIAIPASAVGAVRASGGSTGELGFDTGLEYARVGRDTGQVGFRVGGLFSERVDLGVSAPPLMGMTLATALLFVVSTSAPQTGSLTHGGRTRFAVGPALDATVVGRRDHDRGQLGAGLSVDLYDLTQWTVR